jgi:hypothetical protein
LAVLSAAFNAAFFSGFLAFTSCFFNCAILELSFAAYFFSALFNAFSAFFLTSYSFFSASASLFFIASN